MSAPAASSPGLQRVLDETRQRFIGTFAARCDAIRLLVDAAGTANRPLDELTQMAHRLTGLAGTIGFPTISARGCELEALADSAGSGTFDASLARGVLDAIQAAFTHDLLHPPAWAPPALCTAHGAKILVAEDESDQRAIVTTCLEGAGYSPIAVASGDRVVDMARAEKPAVILLDIAMPRLDVYSACRLLKTDPELAGIPVIFMTTGANLDDKLAGLALGADEFLSKPVDMRELVLRIELLLKRCPSPDAPRALATTSMASEPPRPAAAAPVSPIVVVAEDDPDVTRIVDAQVRAAGYRAISVRDGEETLAAVRAHAPDVIVLDLMMPRITGFEVLTQLREGPAPRPRIIVLSGRGREQDVMRAFELGADDYLTKPFNPQELMARIARLIRS